MLPAARTSGADMTARAVAAFGGVVVDAEEDDPHETGGVQARVLERDVGFVGEDLVGALAGGEGEADGGAGGGVLEDVPLLGGGGAVGGGEVAPEGGLGDPDVGVGVGYGVAGDGFDGDVGADVGAAGGGAAAGGDEVFEDRGHLGGGGDVEVHFGPAGLDVGDGRVEGVGGDRREDGEQRDAAEEAAALFREAPSSAMHTGHVTSV